MNNMNNDDKKAIRVIITGVTGMVGEGVLHECLQQSQVEAVLVINRKPCGFTHAKLREIIHPDFYDLSTIENELIGYDACFFCLGVSSIGLKEADYFSVTYTLTLHMAWTLSKSNLNMTFCYVSGAGTDSSEKGAIMWARVKGKTENDLMKLPFKHVYAFRPGFILPIPGLKNTHSYYKYVTWLYPIVNSIFPSIVTSLRQMGLAMINSALYGYEKKILQPKDINLLANSH